MDTQPPAWPDALRSCIEERTRAGLRIREVRDRKASNALQEVVWEDDQVWMAKRGVQYADSAARRFETDRLAAALCRSAGIVAPEHLAVVSGEDGAWMLYPRIPLPILRGVLTAADPEQRAGLFSSWGVLVRRIHRVPLGICGALRADLGSQGGIREVLEQDLGERLLRSLAGRWSEGLPLCDALLQAAPALGALGLPVVLNHNDLHFDNILCSTDGAACVGVLDLEAAMGGPAEIDLARMQVYHGARLGMRLQDDWFCRLLEGYGSAPDAHALAYFRAYHRLNLGYHFAITGHRGLSALLLADAAGDIELL
jgi:aminoglycoside phosphotransferase (APT) family kinase protein